MSGRAPTANAFLNGTNYQKIVGVLKQHYNSNLGLSTIPERMDSRLQKTVQHYMQEIYRVQGTTKPVNALSQEVLKESIASMDVWLKKQETAAPNAITTVGSFPSVTSQKEDYHRLYEDTSTNFERLMSDRNYSTSSQPTIPDFRPADILENNEEDPIILMQRLQKQREEQARALGIPTGNTPSPTLNIREEPTPSANRPEPPQADVPPALLAPRPQDYIIPQEDIVKYYEIEHNLFITSSDRDWLRNTDENRYNFTVNFNNGSKKTGFTYSPAIQNRFRNIQRIEFVKAIVPIESLAILPKVVSESPTVVYDTTRVINVFSLPFVSVRIAELNNNGFSTNPEEDNTFAIVQYDTTWSSDLVAPAAYNTTPAPILSKSGYAGLIPKFLKTQRIYTPTPLATLQRLTLRLERHNTELLSADSDVISIARICMSGAFTSVGTDNTLYSVNGAGVENSYIFIKSAKYFTFSAVSEGDHIEIQGYTPITTNDTSADFTKYINRPEGHYVVACGYTDAAGAFNDGRNSAGYCNVIIIRSRFNDPTTGSTQRTNSYFGGSLMNETGFATDLDNESNQTMAAFINHSRQTHFVIRIITRDMDSSSNVRPDNI